MVTIDSLIRMMFEKNASDLHLTAGAPPKLRLDGELIGVEMPALTEEICRTLIQSVLSEEQREQLEKESGLSFSFGIEKIGRVRMTVFKQQGMIAASLRSVPGQILSFEEMGLPGILKDIVQLPKGLVLITGPTGSGKSSTLASMLDWINRNRSVHILTLEDPIEYLHPSQKAIVNQREIGVDAPSYAGAVKNILRSDPDVVLMSELPDSESVQAALTVAEMGHLVIAALQTTDSVQAIYRLIDFFSEHQQFRIRFQLSIVLQAILSQQLLPRGYASGRILACEVLIPTSTVRNLIREEKEHEIYSIMQAGGEYGMQTMNQALVELYQKQLVTYNEIFSRTTDPRDLQRLVKGTT